MDKRICCLGFLSEHCPKVICIILQEEVLDDIRYNAHITMQHLF